MPKDLVENQKVMVLNFFKEIKMYCEVYQEWPRKFCNPKTEKELLSRKLYIWLQNHGYFKNNFQYSDILTYDGLNIKDELDRLYFKYNHKKKFATMYYEKIKNFCIKYNEFPSGSSKIESEKEKESQNLYQWLLDSGYFKGEFIYNNVKTDDGVSIKSKIDELYNKYDIASIKKVINIVKEIREYSVTYKEWPKNYNYPKTEKEFLSNRLSCWLRHSNYNKGNFKYVDIKINELSIKTILDYYYFMFSVKGVWIAKNGCSLEACIYYYIISLWRELENNNEAKIKYYCEILTYKLKSDNFNLEEIISILKEDIDIVSEYFLHKYLEYSIANDTLAYLYKSLYEYSLYKKENKIESSR